MTAPTPTGSDCTPDIQLLVDHGIDAARRALGADATFPPFALTLHGAGEVRALEIEPPPGPPDAGPMVSTLLAELKERCRAGSVRATAILMDVKIDQPEALQGRTAICLGLEHREGYAEDVYIPYRLEDGTVSLETPHAVSRRPRVFPGDAGR